MTRLVGHVWFGAIDLSGAYFQVFPMSEDQKYLTTRINGRIYQYTGCPQGLSSSPAVCVERFTHWFEQIGATAHYFDNAAFTGNSREEVEHKLKQAINFLETNGIRISPEQTVPPCKVLPFLGLQVSYNRIELPLKKQEKLKTLLSAGNTKQLNGYYSYLKDVFGRDGQISTHRTFHPARIHTDGVKGGRAAAGLFCFNCDGLIKCLTRSAKQSSQVHSECQALLLGFKLRKWMPNAPIFTDAKYLCLHHQRRPKLTIASLTMQAGPTASYVPSSSNLADALSRGKPTAMCACA